MKRVNTLRFGEIEVEDEQIIHFEKGIPAFEDEHEFVLIIQDAAAPYAFLQSLSSPDLAFLMTRPFVFFPDYEFVLNDIIEEQLGLKSEEELDIFTLVTIPGGDIKKMTTNLLAPIVINKTNKKAQQCVLEKTNYTTKHALFPNAHGGKEGK